MAEAILVRVSVLRNSVGCGLLAEPLAGTLAVWLKGGVDTKSPSHKLIPP